MRVARFDQIKVRLARRRCTRHCSGNIGVVERFTSATTAAIAVAAVAAVAVAAAVATATIHVVIAAIGFV
jgi:hypothetical protein